MKYTDEYKEATCDFYEQIMHTKIKCSKSCRFFFNCPKLIMEDANSKAVSETDSIIQESIPIAMQAMSDILKEVKVFLNANSKG